MITKEQCIQAIENNIRFVQRNQEGAEDSAAWDYMAEMDEVISDIKKGRVTNYDELFNEYGRV